MLVRGFGAVLDGPYPHVLIEHLEGPTLRRLIKRHGPLPLQQLLPLALHIAAAVHYLSCEETVHLDIKPDTIVMGVPPGLIDLSIARSYGNRGTTGTKTTTGRKDGTTRSNTGTTTSRNSNKTTGTKTTTANR